MPLKKQSFVHGAIVLTVSTVIVKIIGMFYKIPLGNILGAVGMSYFMTAYNIFNPVYALSVAGLPVAVSKMVAESAVKRNYRETKRIFRSSFALFLITGVLGSVIMFFASDLAAALVRNPDAALAIKAMSPAILFCCVISAYRGYYQGLGNMSPTAVSQIMESVFKLVCGIGLAWFMLNTATQGYEAGSAAFGAAVSHEQARLLALPWAAAGAILGVTASSAVSALYLGCSHMFGGDGITKQMLAESAKAPSRRSIIKTLSMLAFPVCIGSVLTQITSLIDVATIMNRVNVAVSRGSDIVTGMYSGRIPPEVTLETLPQFLYGAYGYCSSLFNLVPALTIPLGISALPLISSHLALKNRVQAAKHAQSVIKLASLLSIPAGLGLSVLADPVLALLYPARLDEVAVAAPMLRSLGIAAALVGITAPMSSIFQAAGRADIPVKLMAAGAALKLAMNHVLLAVPSLNVGAAPYGTIVCYFFIFTFGLLLLQKVLRVQIDIVPSFVKPLFCGIICAGSAYTSYMLLEKFIESKLLCLISITIGGIIYSLFILFLKIITKNEILMLPGGKKIAKTLEKLSFLG